MYWIEGSQGTPGQMGEVLQPAFDPTTGDLGWQVRLADGKVDLVSADMVRRLNAPPTGPMLMHGSPQGWVELDGKLIQTESGPRFQAPLIEPSIDQFLSVLSGYPVEKRGKTFFADDQALGVGYDRAWISAMERSPDPEFLEGLSMLGKILGQKAGKKGTVSDVVMGTTPDQFAKKAGKRILGMIEEAGYASPSDFWQDSFRYLNEVERHLFMEKVSNPARKGQSAGQSAFTFQARPSWGHFDPSSARSALERIKLRLTDAYRRASQAGYGQSEIDNLLLRAGVASSMIKAMNTGKEDVSSILDFLEQHRTLLNPRSKQVELPFSFQLQPARLPPSLPSARERARPAEQVEMFPTAPKRKSRPATSSGWTGDPRFEPLPGQKGLFNPSQMDFFGDSKTQERADRKLATELRYAIYQFDLRGYETDEAQWIWDQINSGNVAPYRARAKELVDIILPGTYRKMWLEDNPRYPNPPVWIRVAGVYPTPISAQVETSTGEVLSSPSFRAMEGSILGSGVDIVPVVEGYKKSRKTDFKSPKQAWEQFRALNASIAQNSADPIYYHGQLDAEDAAGITYETIKEHYGSKKKLKKLEEVIKYIVRKEKIKKWEDFPRWVLDQAGVDTSWMQIPQVREVEGQSVSDDQVSQMFHDAQYKFTHIFHARTFLEEMRGKMTPAAYAGLLNAWQEMSREGEITDSAFVSFLNAVVARAGEGPTVIKSRKIKEVPLEEGIPF